MNENFASVDDNGQLVYAEDSVKTKFLGRDVVVQFPSEELRNSVGKFRVNASYRPECPEGHRLVPTGRWKVEDNECHQVFDIVPAPVAVPATRQFSKLKLYAVLARMNLWQPLVEWMQEQTYDGMSAYTAFVLAQDLSEDHPMFSSYLSQAKAALGVDDAAVDTILAASVRED